MRTLLDVVRTAVAAPAGVGVAGGEGERVGEDADLSSEDNRGSLVFAWVFKLRGDGCVCIEGNKNTKKIDMC